LFVKDTSLKLPKDVKKKQKNEDPELINPSELARRSGDTNCEIGSNTSSHCRSGANAVKEYYVGSVAGGKCRVGSGFGV